MQFFRKMLDPSTTRSELLGSRFSYQRPLGFTLPGYKNVGLVWSAMTVDQWLALPWLRRAVSITTNGGSGSGYIVGPRHVLTAAHLLPWVGSGGFGASLPNTPNPVDPAVSQNGTVDLSNVPAASDFGQMNLRVHLMQGVFADKANPPQVIAQESNFWLPLSHSPVQIQTAAPPFPGPFGGEVGLGDDFVVLIMDDTFAGLVKALGLGWDPVMNPSEMLDTMLKDRFIRTGWAEPGPDDYCKYELAPPPAPYKGYWGATATARTEYNARFQQSLQVPPFVPPPPPAGAAPNGVPEAQKWPSTIYKSETSDMTPGDSGSALFHWPSFNGKSGPPSIAAILVAESGYAEIVPDAEFGLTLKKFKSVNYAVSGTGLYLLWKESRLNHP